MSKLTRNILSNLVGQSVVLVLGFIAVRFIYRRLGSDAVGLVFFALTLNNAMTAVMDLGISSTIVRQVARSGLDRSYVQRLIRTASLFYWVSYVTLATILVLAAGSITKYWLRLEGLDAGTATTSFGILGAGSLLALPKSLYTALFRGLQRMGVSNAVDVAGTAVQQAGIVALILMGGGIIVVSWWIAASTFLGIVAYAIVASRVVPVRALIPGLDPDVLRENFGYASRMTIVSVLATLHTHADKVIASRLLPLGLFGLYGFGFSALSRGMLLTGAVAQAAFPSLSELHRLENRAGLLSQYRRLQDIVSYMMAAVFAVAPFAVPAVFGLLFGPSESDQMLIPCTLLAVGFYMNSTLNMPYMLSLAMGKPEIAVSLNAWAIAVVLPITVVLVGRWGLTGAALSWVVYHVFAYLYAVPRLCRECIGEPSSRWYVGVSRFCSLAAVTYGLGWFAAATTGGSTIAFGSTYALATGVYSTLGWGLLSADTRRRVRALLRDGLLEEYDLAPEFRRSLTVRDRQETLR